LNQLPEGDSRELQEAVMSDIFFLYARKSTESEERQVLSIESQIVELRSLAQKENIVIKAEFTESMTAKEPGRPLFNEMISRIEKGEAQGIIAWHPDRLARNSVDGGRIVYLLDTGHIKFLKFPTFWFESSPQGKFMLNIAFGQSKYMVDNLSENVKRGQRQKLRRGEWPGWAPLGYLNHKDLRKVVIDPVKGPLVRELFDLYATGHHNLPELQKLTFGSGLMSRKGKPLSKSELQRTLKRPFYYGLMKYTGEWHQGTHEPLVTKELFDKVQAVIQRQSRPKKRKNTFALLGFATCATCGGAITAERQKGHHYYRCTKKKGKCTEPYVREEHLAEQVRAAIAKVALPPDVFQQMMAEWAKEQETARQPIAPIKAELQKKTVEVQKKIDRLLELHLDGLIEKSEYRSKKEILLNKKVELEEEIKKAEEGAIGWLEPCREFLQAAHQAHQVLATGNLEAQKLVLQEKIGSNLRRPLSRGHSAAEAAPSSGTSGAVLGAKTLHFDFSLPWRRFAATASCSTWRRRRDSNPRYGFTRTLV
jgi:site-specific DNA recombinase